jgi:hypothetical protein
MDENLVLDRAKGELRIFGKRHTALDAQSLCDHLDSLVGPTVAEVIINNHEFRSGKQDASQFRRERPQATAREIVDIIIETDLLSGTGITKVTTPEGEVKEPGFLLEIRNPSVKPSSGCGRALLLSYWCGALAFLFNGEFEAKDVLFNEAENVLTARIGKRVVM